MYCTFVVFHCLCKPTCICIPYHNSLPFPFPPVSSLFTKAIVTVLDTDYISFAALYECSNMKGIRIPRRTKGTILSRAPTLDPATVETVSFTARSNYNLYLS